MKYGYNRYKAILKVDYMGRNPPPPTLFFKKKIIENK
jgi:hypothetical protein